MVDHFAGIIDVDVLFLEVEPHQRKEIELLERETTEREFSTFHLYVPTCSEWINGSLSSLYIFKRNKYIHFCCIKTFLYPFVTRKHRSICGKQDIQNKDNTAALSFKQ